MKRKSKTSSPRYGQAAMTLVEVVASLALLGTLFGGVVMAKGRLTRQWIAAQQRGDALVALDRQLQQWHQAMNADTTQASFPSDTNRTSTAWPTSGRGPIESGPWWWQANILDQPQTPGNPGNPRSPGSQSNPENPGTFRTRLQVIRYTAFDPASPDQAPAATLDIISLLPAPEAPEPSELQEALETTEAAS